MGSGPAGYTAAIYTGRANLGPVLYEGMLTGGQLTTTTEIENFPGYPEGVTGQRMMEDLRAQALKFGVDIRRGVVTHADLKKRPFRLTIDNETQVEADSLIIATGATAKYLGLHSENKFHGMGVSACATCDGFFYRNQDVAIVGGGDTACEDASYLANICNKVYMIVRKDHLRASRIMQRRVKENPKIEILFEHNTKDLLGDDTGLTGVLVEKTDGTQRRLDVTGFFLAIGHHPNTRIFQDQLDLNPEGYIVTRHDSTATSVKGVFAAGDVRDPNYRQAIVAAGSGCMAALDCERFLLLEGVE
jgi:thioredoxin reductase (NADPH)